MLASKVRSWQIPSSLNAFQAYGLWNCLLAYDPAGGLLAVIPAHDGDFFPETPFDYIERLRAGPVEEAWPVRVDIDVTQVCTDRCFFCYSRPYAKKNCYQAARLPLADYERLLATLAEHGTVTVRFTGGGEPLEHPHIRQMLALPHKYGLKTCLITNGSLLDDELDELLVQHVDHIRVSVNAGTDATRRAIHRSTVPGASLTRLQTHLRKISALRAACFNNARRPSIWTTFLILPHNVHEIVQAAADMAACGADSISFRPVYHAVYQSLPPLDKAEMEAQLAAVRAQHCPPRFQVFTPRRNLTEAGALVPDQYFDRCRSCYLRTVVEAAKPNPLLKVCGLYRGEEDGVVAVLEHGFGTAWNSTQAADMLSDRPQRCQTCIDISMNLTLAGVKRVLNQYSDAIFSRGWQRDDTSAGQET